MAEKHSGFEAQDDIDMNSHKLVDVTDPTNPQDAATKAYVDAQVGAAGGLVFIEQVDLSGGAAKTLSSSVLDLLAYKGLMIRWQGSVITTRELFHLRFNDDSSGSYDTDTVNLGADSHAKEVNLTGIRMGYIEIVLGGGTIFISLNPTVSYTTVQGFSRAGAFSGEFSKTDAITKISLITVTNNMNTNMVMQIWGIK